MRLALLSSGLGYTVRGIETWMLELFRHLPSSIDVELWSGGPVADRNEPRMRRIHSANRDSWIFQPFSWHRRYIFEQLSMVGRAAMALRAGRFDAVYCGDPVLSWHLKRLRKFHGAKVIFMNGMRLSANWAKEFDGVHLLAPAYLEQARQELTEAGAQNFFAVPHFVDTAQFHPANGAEKMAAREHFGLLKDAFVVLTAGPIGRVSGKRLEWLAREVAASDATTVLVSVGVDEDGAEEIRNEARSALGNRFVFLGRMDRARMADLYRAADVYSLGSLAEPFSIAILEALASGLPVVHHRDEVMRWQTGEGGCPVSMIEMGEAAKAFRELKSDVTRREQKGSAARALAEGRYAPGPVCDALVSALEGIVQGAETAHRKN